MSPTLPLVHEERVKEGKSDSLGLILKLFAECSSTRKYLLSNQGTKLNVQSTKTHPPTHP